jgi:hypothetical protein
VGREFVRVSARAGEVGLRIGLARAGGGDASGGGGAGLDGETREMGREVVLECRGMGGTLEAIGQVIEACSSDELIKARCAPSPDPLTHTT